MQDGIDGDAGARVAKQQGVTGSAGASERIRWEWYRLVAGTLPRCQSQAVVCIHRRYLKPQIPTACFLVAVAEDFQQGNISDDSFQLLSACCWGVRSARRKPFNDVNIYRYGSQLEDWSKSKCG